MACFHFAQTFDHFSSSFLHFKSETVTLPFYVLPQNRKMVCMVARSRLILGSEWSHVPCDSPHAVKGMYKDVISSTGWSFLTVSTNETFSNRHQAYGAGYLEGLLTSQRTYEYIFNMQNLSTGGFLCMSNAYLRIFC